MLLTDCELFVHHPHPAAGFDFGMDLPSPMFLVQSKPHSHVSVMFFNNPALMITNKIKSIFSRSNS